MTFRAAGAGVFLGLDALGARPAPAEDPAGDLLIVHDDTLHATYVSPWIDFWPRPDFMIYPVVAATARTRWPA